ncbi:HTH cro/C1-type domain-containing protein, partial [Dysosmobacter welbionis]
VPDTENGAGRFCEQPVPGQQMGRSGGAGGSDRPGGPVYAVFERRRRQRNDGIVDCGHRGLWRGGGGDRRAGLHLVCARRRGGSDRRHGGGGAPDPAGAVPGGVGGGPGGHPAPGEKALRRAGCA